jgi:hypothetical protein
MPVDAPVMTTDLMSQALGKWFNEVRREGMLKYPASRASP